MKNIIITLAAVAALIAGASAAEAGGRYNRYYGGNGYSNHSYNYYSFKNQTHNNHAYRNYGYRNHGYTKHHYVPVYSYNQPECHNVTVKKVFWQDGYKYVKFTTKLVCDSYGY
jgi:uncharacterized protein YxeA